MHQILKLVLMVHLVYTEGYVCLSGSYMCSSLNIQANFSGSHQNFFPSPPSPPPKEKQNSLNILIPEKEKSITKMFSGNLSF